MTIIGIIIPLPALPWGIDRLFTYIIFFATGNIISKVISKNNNHLIGGGIQKFIIASLFMIINFYLSQLDNNKGLLWFLTAFVGVFGTLLFSIIIKENRLLEYLGRNSLIILCIHGPVYRILVKLVSLPIGLNTDTVRKNLFLTAIVIIMTFAVCAFANTIVFRYFPWMLGTKRRN